MPKLPALELPVIANTKAAEAGLARVNQAVAKVQATSKVGASAFQKLGNVTNGQRFVFQNTANQLGDMAVQIGMGTSAMRTMGLQVPQLLGGFVGLGGAAGIVLPALGAIAAIGFPIAAAFMAGGKEAEDFADILERVQAVSSSLGDSLDLIKMDMQELEEKFGSAALEVRKFIVAQAELRVALATTALREQIDLLDDVIDKYNLIGRGDRLSRPMMELAEATGLTNAQARNVAETFEAIQSATTFDESKEALSTLIDQMGEYGMEASDLPPEIQKAVDQMISLTNATLEAKALMDALADAAAGVALPMTTGEGLQWNGGVGIMPPSPMNTGTGLTIPLRMSTLMPPAASGSRRSGGGGGTSEAEKLARAYESLRSSLDPVWAATKKYKDAQETLNKALDAGLINQGEFTELLGLAKEQLDGVSDATKNLQSVADTLEQSMTDAFMAMIDGTKSAQDAFRDMAKAVIAELYRILVVQQLVGSFDAKTGQGSGIVGFLMKGFSSFDGGGFTGMGGRSGGIDGKGGFPAILHPNETVVDHTKGGSVGGSVVVNQTLNFSTGVQSTVRAEILGLMPQIADSAKAAVIDGRQRGGAMRKVFS